MGRHPPSRPPQSSRLPHYPLHVVLAVSLCSALSGAFLSTSLQTSWDPNSRTLHENEGEGEEHVADPSVESTSVFVISKLTVGGDHLEHLGYHVEVIILRSARTLTRSFASPTPPHPTRLTTPQFCSLSLLPSASRRQRTLSRRSVKLATTYAHILSIY